MIADLLEPINALFEQASLGIAVFDQTGQIILANAALETMFGYAPGELLGEPLSMLVPEHMRGIHAAHVAGFTGAPRTRRMGHGLELTGRHKNGSNIPIEVNLSYLPHEGQIIPVAMVADVTERKRIERERDRLLRAAEEAARSKEQALALLDTVLQSAPVGFAFLDRDLRYQIVNRHLAEINGHAPEAHIGRTTAEIVPHLAGTLEPVLRGVLETGEPILNLEISQPSAAQLDQPRQWLCSYYPVRSGETLLGIGGMVVEVTESNRTKAALRASEARFGLLAENAQDMIYRYCFAPTRGFEYVSPAALSLTGYSPEEYYADSELGDKIIHPDDRHILDELLQSSTRGEEPLVLRWIRKDGAIIWTEQRNVYIYDSSGAVIGVEGIARDITKRKEAEITLRDSEERFRATFEQAPLGIAHIAPTGVLLRVNQRLCDIVGYTRDELIERNLIDVVFTDTAAAAEPRIRQLIAGEIPSYTIEQKYCLRNGVSIWLSVTLSLVRGGACEPKYFIALIEDITHRRLADETRARLAAIVDSSESAIISKALDGTILSWNASAERIFGYSAAEVIGQNVSLLLPADRSGEETSILARIRAGERIAHFESVRVRKDGQPIEIALTISPIRDGDGNIVGISKIARDNTAQKRAEEALRQQTIYTHLLQSVAVAANQAITPTQALQVAIDQICKHIGWPIGHVYLPHEGGQHVLRSTDIWHFDDPERYTLLRTITRTIDLSEDDDLPTRVLLSGLPEWAADLQAAFMGRRNQLIGETGVRASFAFPVLVGAEVVAVMEFFADEPHKPDEPLQIVMAHIGTQLGQVFERERAAAALRASEERYRLIADNTVDVIALIARSGHFAYASPSFQTVLGYDPSELYSGAIEKLVDPDWLESSAQMWAETLAHGVAQATLRLRHADGSWRLIDVRAARAAESRERYVVAIGHDVTERMQTEHALRAAEARYRTLVEQLPAIVYTAAIDPTSSTRYVSPQIETILGFSAEEWIAKPDLWLKQVHPDDRDRVLEDVALTQSSDAPRRSEYRSFTRDGRLVWLEDTSHIVRDEAGNPLFMQGVAVDITERKRAEQALRRSERLYRTLIRNFPNGAVMLFDHDLRYTIADGAGTSDIDGLSPKDIEGRTIWEAHSPEMAAMVEPRYQAALDGMPTIAEESFNERTFVFYILPVRDERGQIIAGMVMTQDITERKRIERALMEERALLAQRVEERTADLSAANAELARAARLKDEFLANMSHELRTPLNAVLGLSEALLEEAYGELADGQARALRTIAESGRHLLDLINDILDLAKIGAGKLELDIGPVSVSQVCQASLRLVKQSALKKRISVDSSIDPAATTLLGDARRLKQSLTNLLSNAVKFTPEGGSIGLEVRADAEHRRVDLAVWDTGIGIAQEHFERLFKPFVQLDSRLARQFEGTGLGLALVYRMVEMHGGSIAVESTVGAGSRFTISLPWEPDSQPADEQERDRLSARAQAGAARAETRASTILLAEDNETNISLVSDYLTARGYRVVVTRNGAEALARAREIRPDLVLMDIQMPGVDGLEATRRLRADAELSAIPIIALTALAMPGDRERCLEAGANAYLSKPVSLRRLESAIDSNISEAV